MEEIAWGNILKYSPNGTKVVTHTGKKSSTGNCLGIVLVLSPTTKTFTETQEIVHYTLLPLSREIDTGLVDKA